MTDRLPASLQRGSRPEPPVAPHVRGSLGNHALARWLGRKPATPEVADETSLAEDFEQIVSDAMLTMALAIGGTGQTIALTGSVGRGGKNLRRDVSAICVRLLALGFNPGTQPAELEATIERYQREVVGARRPDGRIDPGGRTLAALVQGKRAPAPEPGEETAPAAAAPAQPAAAPAAQTPSGPRKSEA
ncbi:hypothetical protein OJ998_25495, partial [Solirubrobacter taibaiensis]|nr:hypothetical protein [Solirubrobacter taibaiensis]